MEYQDTDAKEGSPCGAIAEMGPRGVPQEYDSLRDFGEIQEAC